MAQKGPRFPGLPAWIDRRNVYLSLSVKEASSLLGWKTGQIMLRVLDKTFGSLFLNSMFDLGETGLICYRFFSLY